MQMDREAFLAFLATGNQAGIIRQQCLGKLCIVSMSLSPAAFDSGRPTFVPVEGSALAQTAVVDVRKLRGLQLVVEDTETVEMSFGAEIARAQDRYSLPVVANERGEEGNGGGDTKIVTWLLPLIVLLLCCLCITFACCRRRKEVPT